MLSSLLALPGVLVKDVTELVPPGFRDQNRVLEIPLHLRDGDVTPLGVFLAREEEVLVLDLDVAGLVGGYQVWSLKQFLCWLFTIKDNR